MLRTPLRRSWLGLALTLVLVSVFVFSFASQAGASSFTFKTFELGDFNPPGAPGTVCPQSTESQACTNYAAEPAIRADPAGNFYASSEHGLGGGTDAWRSSDGGQHYVTLVSPNAVSQTNTTGFAPGGGDTDLAVAPVKNSAGNYNVYVASLNLANVDVSTSKDKGNTWTLNPAAATISGDDREWIAADQSSKVCISYHDIETFNIDVNCSTDAGKTFTQLGDAIDTSHAFLINNNQIGNLMINPSSHIIYQIFNGIHDASEIACGEAGTCGYHTVWMAVSTDGGKTFTDYMVYNGPKTASYNHNFTNVSIDNAGNVYSVFSNNHNVYYSYSTTHGKNWSSIVQVNSSPANTAIFPWSVANHAGRIDIVYYGTSYFKAGTPPDSYPNSAAWYVYMAQNLSATTSGSSFTQVRATPIVHFGGVCEGGISCTGNRDLYDDFGVAANPHTGLASIVYSDDQYTNDVSDPPASSSCTPSANNSPSCDHTSIATQTGGPGI